MNRFKCPACGGNQYTSADTAEGCIYCGNKELKKMEILEPKEGEGMREIKFRGKRKDNGDWVHGYYLIVDNKHLIFPPNAHFNQIGYYSKKGCFGEILQEGTCWICEVDRESVGQFTGLHDKNGKEIYENIYDNPELLKEDRDDRKNLQK